MSKKVLVLNTGGTFNKVYDPIKGELVIDEGMIAIKSIANKWQHNLDIVSIMDKDSLHMNSKDRVEMLSYIYQSEYNDIIIIHGTDTMEISAEYIAEAEVEKRIVLTGAMVPYSIDPVEATANFAMAYGFLQNCTKDGVYISMNGLVDEFKNITKDRKNGVFVRVKG